MENVTSLEALQNELEFYRQNQTLVEQEIRSLIADNQNLSKQVGTLLKEKLQNAQQSQQPENRESEECRRQVALITKERDSLHVLWQSSQKTIEALELELKTYQSYDDRIGKQTTTEERRDLELKLETALSDYVELESKYKELYVKNKNLENELRSKEKEITLAREKDKQELEEKAESTKVVEELKVNLAVERKTNEDVKKQLAVLQKEFTASAKREVEAKSKVSEALQLFDVVQSQKEEALQKATETTEELSALKQTLANSTRKLEANLRKELDDIKDKYNEKVADMLEHIRNLDAELVEKGILLNKSLRELKIQQDINESFLKEQKENEKSVDPRLNLAEERLEVMLQELVASERRNIQIVCEKQCLAVDIQRLQDMHARETKRRDWEENLLKTQCGELRLQVEHLQKSLDETHGMVNKLQNMLSSRTELNNKMVSSKEEELAELNKQLNNQMDLSKKWKESYVEMTENLKIKLEELQNENKELRMKLDIKSLSNDEYSSTNS